MGNKFFIRFGEKDKSQKRFTDNLGSVLILVLIIVLLWVSLSPLSLQAQKRASLFFLKLRG